MRFERWIRMGSFPAIVSTTVLLASSLAGGCSAAEGPPVDLGGTWSGTFEAGSEGLSRLTLRLFGETDEGTWRFEDLRGEGCAFVRRRDSRGASIRLEQDSPCLGLYDVSLLLVADDTLDGTIEGEDCSRTMAGTVELTRTSRDDLE